MDKPQEAWPSKEAGILKYVIGLISCLLIALPTALALLYVRAFGVSVVFLDAWRMVPLFDKWSSGRLRLSDLFHQHHEHRLFFPKIVELLLGSITKYDNVAEMYVVQICLLLTLVVLLLAFRSSIKSSWLPLFIPVSFLIFSFRQHVNMLFGYQICFALTQASSVLTLFLLYVLGHTRFRKSTFAAALAGGTVASFSAAQGLLVWPVGLLQLFIGRAEKPAKKVFTISWGLAGLGVWVAYFADYVYPKPSPPLLHALGHPIAATQYFLSLLGSSLFWQQDSAFLGGLLLACLVPASLLLVYRTGRLGEYSFWVSLLLYSFLVLLSITVGRSGFGIEQALASRYTSFSILMVVGIYAILVKTGLQKRSRLHTISLIALSGMLLLSFPDSYQEGIYAGAQEKASREKAAFILSTYESQPDAALAESLRPNVEVVRKGAPILQRLGYNVFSEPQAHGLPPRLSTLSPISSPPTSSAIDVVDTDAGVWNKQDQLLLVAPEEASYIKVNGWAVDTGNHSTAGGVYVDVDGKPFPAFYGTERQDVADSVGLPSYRYSGFERYIPVSEIGAGTHELSIFVLTADQKGYYQPDYKTVLKIKRPLRGV